MASLLDCQAVVEKLKHNYVRLAPLQSQLLADVPAHGQHRDPSRQQSALKHFVICTTQGQQYLDRLSRQRPLANGKQKNGLQTPPAPESSLFLRQLQQEVERLRRFVHSSAEELWMRLLAAAEGLSELSQTAVKLQSQPQQQEYLLHHQELHFVCDRIGEQQTQKPLEQWFFLQTCCYLHMSNIACGKLEAHSCLLQTDLQICMLLAWHPR